MFELFNYSYFKKYDISVQRFFVILGHISQKFSKKNKTQAENQCSLLRLLLKLCARGKEDRRVYLTYIQYVHCTKVYILQTDPSEYKHAQCAILEIFAPIFLLVYFRKLDMQDVMIKLVKPQTVNTKHGDSVTEVLLQQHSSKIRGFC